MSANGFLFGMMDMLANEIVVVVEQLFKIH